MSKNYLPEDLLFLVLVRLPAISLWRFRRVSKSWNALISSPEFIKFHLNLSRNNQKPNILVWNGLQTTSSCNEISAVEFSITGKNFKLGLERQRLLQQPTGHQQSYHVGSCNGLLCNILVNLNFSLGSCYQCSEEKEKFTLCNPFTKSYWVLPKRPAAVFRDQVTSVIISFYGFGYDDVHDDYKVMLAYQRFVPGHHPDFIHVYPPPHEYEFEVYSLRSNSWEQIRSYLDYRGRSINNNNINPSSVVMDGVLTNCALHWISIHEHSDLYGGGLTWKNSILAFDLRTNKHRFLSLPEVVEELRPMKLSVLNNGCLVLYKDWLVHDLKKPNTMLGFDLWVMKDYGLKDSWTRITIRNIPYHMPSLTPVALLESNKRKLIIFYNYLENGLVLLYDLASERVVKRIRSSSREASCFQHTRQQFVGSLVQPYPLGSVVQPYPPF